MKRTIFILLMLTGLALNLTKNGWGLIALNTISAESWDGEAEYVYDEETNTMIYENGTVIYLDTDDPQGGNIPGGVVLGDFPDNEDRDEGDAPPPTPPIGGNGGYGYGYDGDSEDDDGGYYDGYGYDDEDDDGGYSDEDDDGGYDDGIGDNGDNGYGDNDPTDDSDNNETGNEQPDPNNETYDCMGVLNGTAYIDNCGYCVGGSTGKQACCKTTLEDLKRTFPNASDAVLSTLASLLNQYGGQYGINNADVMQHFLAQAGHESNGFTSLTITENLNYTSAERLVSVFPSRFSLTDPNKKNPNDYINNPTKLANYIYSNRMGNGNENSGDGYNYRGRGIFQFTGRGLYTEFNNYYNAINNPPIDLINNPNLLSSNNTLSILSALWYFQTKVLNRINVDGNTSVRSVTWRINGGYNGLLDRQAKYNNARQNIKCN